jgi:hypothetical protein
MEDAVGANAIEMHPDFFKRKISMDVVHVVTLAGPFAMGAVYLLVRAEDDKAPTLPQNTPPFKQHGLRILKVLEQVR